jgi:hypothetical protein
VLAGGLVLVPLAGCSFGSDTVSCSPTSCTATLSGDAASVDILGTTVTFGGVQDGRATLGVGDASVSCAEGESVGAGPLKVTCTTVTADAVEITASLG